MGRHHRDAALTVQRRAPATGQRAANRMTRRDSEPPAASIQARPFGTRPVAFGRRKANCSADHNSGEG